MTVEDALNTARHVVRVLRQVATTLEEAGTVLGEAGIEAQCKLCQDQASLCKQSAQVLENALLRALAPLPDETPPHGAYLVRLSDNLETPYTWLSPTGAKWITERLVEGRRVVRHLLQGAEITAEADLIAWAQAWIDKVDNGPPRGDL